MQNTEIQKNQDHLKNSGKEKEKMSLTTLTLIFNSTHKLKLPFPPPQQQLNTPTITNNLTTTTTSTTTTTTSPQQPKRIQKVDTIGELLDYTREFVKNYNNPEYNQLFSDGELENSDETILYLNHHLNNPTSKKRKNLRLIYRGKILELHRLISFYGISPFDVLHCVISDATNISNSQQNESENNNNTTTNTNNNSGSRGGVRTGEDNYNLKGFDKLKEMGIPDEEINLIRSQFYRNHSSNLKNLSQEEKSKIEEEWLEENNNPILPQNTDNPFPQQPEGEEGPQRGHDDSFLLEDSSFSSRVMTDGMGDGGDPVTVWDTVTEYNEFTGILGTFFNGNMYEFLVGSLLGFLLNVISLIFLFETSISRKFKLGVVFGLAISATFSFIALFLPSYSPTNAT